MLSRGAFAVCVKSLHTLLAPSTPHRRISTTKTNMPPKSNSNKRQKPDGDATDHAHAAGPPAPATPIEWAATLQAQLTSVQQSLRQAQADRQRLQVELKSQLRQHQASVVGEVSSLYAELAVTQAQLLAALRSGASKDTTVASVLPASHPLPVLPDELVGHVMSFVLVRVPQ